MTDNLINNIHEFFNNKKVRKTFLKLRLPIGLLCLIFIATLIKPAWFFPGLLVSILGEAFQVWCLSTIKTQKNLTVTGPYMFMRNPMYIGRFFLVFGILMMTGNIWIMLAFAALYYFYMVNRVKREEKVLSELFGKDYEDYCRDVNRYLPGFKRFDKNQLKSFNRESMTQNNVMINIVAALACYIVLFITTFI
ncbi:MAG: isoprenylcysteine carboxylmethyltransferase family protein [Desulfobacterales bacterium]|jgi:protein-S-isoprenylcysteine O-methyltransferase Ste14|nr:isoprenylcysteine carboxylmethyltransferase family protein [Desulfobacterales bacterium]